VSEAGAMAASNAAASAPVASRRVKPAALGATVIPRTDALVMGSPDAVLARMRTSKRRATAVTKKKNAKTKS
jgi:hypothetical protein